MENDELKEIAAQLRQPSGEKGTAMAHMMHETNIGMTKNAIHNLQVCDSDRILELGHGNCGHLDYLLAQAANLHYNGLELSELMNKEAQTAHQERITKGQASFSLYNGLHVPFAENHFDKIFTVNTVYFWSQPQLLIAEIFRVLKPDGKCCITFADSDFMETLPFTQFGFELYSIQKMKDLVANAHFKTAEIDRQTEQVKTKMGDWVERKFSTMVLSK